MDEIRELKKTIKEQEKQILSCRKAIDTLLHKMVNTDKRARRNSEELRRVTNDINNIKRKLGR